MVAGIPPDGMDRYFAEYLKSTDDRELHKWKHYFSVYTRELLRFRRAPMTFLEIGVYRGGSLPMWKGFFPEGSTLVFVDIDPECKALEIAGTHVRIGDQADAEFLARLAEEFGPFDVVLDDGSHICKHQIASFEGLWPHLRDGGLYMVEDCHTSYWPGFGGGYRNEASFIEYAKRLVDGMHSWYTDQDDLFPFDERAKETCSVRFYDSIVAIEKLHEPELPLYITARNGELKYSRNWAKMRGRKSVFGDKDGR